VISLAPEDILTESFRIIDAEVGAHPFDALEWPVVRRMIHALGDLELANLVHCSQGAVAAGVKAFRIGVPIVTDVKMVATGIQATLREALNVDLHCFLDAPVVEDQAANRGLTRCARAMERAIAAYPEAVFVVGNAPTALSVLVDAVRCGAARPRLILAMPVGFVGVVESKEKAMALDVPIIAVRGRRGGSAVAAAAANALLILAASDRSSHERARVHES
jgi:precorrin-8X/cobalt-precorrin-8 methylmutase